jgi:hypothetical protein
MVQKKGIHQNRMSISTRLEQTAVPAEKDESSSGELSALDRHPPHVPVQFEYS